jgi:hypothetical protein
MGSKFANALGHDGKRYADTVPQVMCQLQRHWDAAGSFVKANRTLALGRSATATS